jgi:hypothetical protein
MRLEIQSQCVARPTICTNDEVIRAEQPAGLLEVGEFPIGKDDDALQKTSSEAEDVD